MLKGLFSSKQDQAYSLSFGKIFYTKYNGIPCSKIALKSGTTKSYEILKHHPHPNIIPIFKLSRSSVYTKRIVPFTQAFEREKTEYNGYVIFKLKEALDFVHTVLKKEHRAISMESIVLEESGQVLLCNFERLKDFESQTLDYQMLSELCVQLTGSEEFVAQVEKNSNARGVADMNFYDSIFKLDLSMCKIEDKISMFENFLRNRSILPTITIKFLFNAFLKDAERDLNKEYKTKTLDFLYSLDEKYFNEDIKILFSILDSNIRAYLLQRFMNQSFTVQELDGITSDLSLGLQVKDKTIKKLTIDFIFQHSFSTEAMSFLLDTMASCTDSESMLLICNYLLGLNGERYCKQIYKLLLVFLSSEKNTLPVYKCIDKYCFNFDKIKIAKEILPSLCSRLIEKDNQEYCFALVEKILTFLRSHKDEIQSKDWSLKSIAGMFSKKAEQPSKFEERVSRFSKEELDEWKDIEIE
ncbi:uncharacterized protein VICG_01059 [Vittaforma corneae ATCC 50505]|uniref:Protein kinase domain-containing protein n=1 Tax=Vittaforma corneae (strain ATCC 50505) TaxID=993615 RepID=L2GMZ3_VITCO|nr:uncharacterized protein VICG_01059 [Vittaforma corneae ATCC 50505]ELA41875.1 hypothetical protein VICG_01059 [Vittaforma corneae ATCC 50505]